MAKSASLVPVEYADATADGEPVDQDHFDEIRALTKDAIFLIVPGFGNSGPEHWQSLWQAELPNTIRVEQDDWDHANKDEWVAKLNEYIERCGDKEIVLIVHSLACPTIVHWANQYAAGTRARILGALLVAPADVDLPVEGIGGFDPVPLEKPLPFKSVVVASQNDVIVSPERAEKFAAAWGSGFENVGDGGHINAASGFGNWPVGEKLLSRLFLDNKSRR